MKCGYLQPFTVLLLSWVCVGCSLHYSAKPHKPADEVKQEDKQLLPRTGPRDIAHVEALSTTQSVEVLLINLGCHPNPHAADGKPSLAFPITSLTETLANLDKTKISHMALVFSRTSTISDAGQSLEIRLADMIPIPLFLMLKDIVGTSGQVADAQPILQFFALTIPYDLLLYFAYQSSMPQLDDPAVYARNREVLINYLSKSTIKNEIPPKEKITQQLQDRGLSSDTVSRLMAFVTPTTSAPTSAELTMVFVAPGHCQHTLVIPLVLPTYTEILYESDIRAHPLAEILSNATKRVWLIKGGSPPCQ